MYSTYNKYILIWFLSCFFFIFNQFVLANACCKRPCHNGGFCSIDTSAKGYNCQCQSGFDPATDCLSRLKVSRSGAGTTAKNVDFHN